MFFFICRAVGCHCPSRGLEVLVGDKSHIFMFEQGGISQVNYYNSNMLLNSL